MFATLAAALALQTTTPAAPDLSWMSGYWLDCSNGREASEAWSDPRAGLMVGWALVVSPSGEPGFEVSHIGPTSQGFAYVAQPSGMPPTVFVMTEAGASHVIFSNPENDFPHHIRYQRDGDRLTARIDGVIEGEARSVEWSFRSAPLNSRCPA